MNAHGHDHQIRRLSSQRRLVWALALNLCFLVVEAVGGIMTRSLALLADAGHMAGDVGALALSLFVLHLAKQPMSGRRTYGLLRAEVLGALFNGAILIAIVVLIFREALERMNNPQPVDGLPMLVIAVAGLAANIGSTLILMRHREADINVEGAFYHMLADSLGSVGAIAAGAVIWTTGWYPVDWIASAVIGVIILVSGVGFLRKTLNILLESTPENIDYDEVKRNLEEVEHIRHVHDLHIWTITSGMPILTAHIGLSGACCRENHWADCLAAAKRIVRERFGITHSTLEVEVCTGEQECHIGCALGSNSPGSRGPAAHE